MPIPDMRSRNFRAVVRMSQIGNEFVKFKDILDTFVTLVHNNKLRISELSPEQRDSKRYPTNQEQNLSG